MNKGNYLLYNDYENEKLIDNIICNLENYKNNNLMIKKLYDHIRIYKQKHSVLINDLETEIFKLIVNSESIYNDMIKNINLVNHNISNNYELFNYENYIKNNNLSQKHIKSLDNIYKILVINKLLVKLNDKDWLLIRENNIIGKLKIMKSKITLYLNVNDDKLLINSKYEQYNGKELIIEINDNDEIYKLIDDRIKNSKIIKYNNILDNILLWINLNVYLVEVINVKHVKKRLKQKRSVIVNQERLVQVDNLNPVNLK